jgi:hypothetical protein
MKTRGRTSRRRGSLPPQAQEPVTVRNRTIVLVLVTFAIAFSTLSVVRYTQKSATWDEPIHLTAGYMALVHGDYRVDTSHPPFVRMWSALPLLALNPAGGDPAAIDDTPPLEWFNEGYRFAHQFLYRDNDADRLLNAARFMVVILGVLLGILIFSWLYEWLGFLPAVIALAFYTLEPNLSAHAALVTTDFGIACFMFGAIYFLWRACRRFTAWNISGVLLFTALAATTKFSAIVLAPVVIILLGIAVLQSSEVSIRRAAAVVALLAVTTVAAIWAAYGFRHAPSETAAWTLHVQDTMFGQRAPLLSNLVAWADNRRLLPNAFLQGFLFNHTSVQGWPSYLAGSHSTSGWWYYFPYAFALKTPVALLVLFGTGLVLYVRKRRELGPMSEAFVVIPASVYLAVAMYSGINIGVRHILPVYPFALLIAAAGVKHLIALRTRTARVGLAGLAVVWIVEFTHVYPDNLAFFNVLGGGPQRGFRHLADSNVGWGGNLKLLKRWMDDAGVSHINLAYFGSADPTYYGIDATYLPGSPTFTVDFVRRPQLPGYVAISSTVLAGPYLEPRWRLFYSGFWDDLPVTVIGKSIRVYWVDEWPESAVSARDVDTHLSLADALLLGMEWPEHAIRHYREYLERRPLDVSAWSRLGIAFTQTGRMHEAIDVFARVVDLAPDDERARFNLAEVQRRAAVADATPLD